MPCSMCDYCSPPRAMAGSEASLRRIGWRYDDVVHGPHRCPVCPPSGPPARLAPEPRPALPNLIMIGAAKAGTTALHSYLDLHPEIGMAPAKELNFFLDPAFESRVDDYAGFFDAAAPIRGETSPWYAMDPLVTDVPERIHASFRTPS